MADQTLTPLPTPTARTSTSGRPMEKFDASFARYDRAIRDNHGKIWSQESLATLAGLFHDGESFSTPSSAVILSPDSGWVRL